MPDDKYTQIWEDVWERIKTYDNIGVDQVNAFFSRLHPQAFSEGFLMLTADTDFIKNWVETKYAHVIQKALEEIYGVSFTVAIEVDPTQVSTVDTPVNQSEIPTPPTTSVSTPIAPATQHKTSDQAATPITTSTTPLSGNETAQTHTTLPSSTQAQANEGFVSEYSFDNFVVGTSNQLAYSMALTVAETPGDEQFNPLFIYGKSGLGKTHLLRAIQNYVAQEYPWMKTVYIDTMELVNDYTNASITKDFSSFRRPYDSADMVFIDDVQNLQGREATLNIVFQILNTLKDHGKQIVLSADRAPKHIDIEERYRSRFNSGGTCDIQPPETETKLGIIRNYIEECKQKDNFTFTISPEAQDYIAKNSSSNIRELKSAITKILFYSNNINKKELSVDEVSQLLRDHFTGGSMKKLSVADIQKSVEQYFSISHADLVGEKRSAHIAHARQIAIYLCRTMIDIPFASIGKEFNRDHTTVMYSVTTIEEKKRESRELNEELEIIQNMIME